ncbi:hypothetical protein JKY72_01935 [Candidatus Gracilibacteria bacterium]|nr:hypothetical protein [Candidatus Gracilibacteria bacterium]
MSNSQINSALSELRSAGAKGTPNGSVVLSAKDGAKWSGKKSNGDPWEMIKNSDTSYNCMC